LLFNKIQVVEQDPRRHNRFFRRLVDLLPERPIVPFHHILVDGVLSVDVRVQHGEAIIAYDYRIYYLVAGVEPQEEPVWPASL
jgi:hypothetical protein